MFKAISLGLMNILRVIIVLWLVVQFTLTLIYVLPTTPIQSVLEPFLDATIGTYFDQNWELFAPNPTDTDYILLVRPLTTKELKVAQSTRLPEDGWYDLSSPVWTKLQGNRFAAYVRLADGLTKATSSYDENGDQESLTLLIEYASAFCKDIGKGDASYVALMLRERRSIPWPEGKTTELPVIKTNFEGIYPIDRSVENIHLYQL